MYVMMELNALLVLFRNLVRVIGYITRIEIVEDIYVGISFGDWKRKDSYLFILNGLESSVARIGWRILEGRNILFPLFLF